METHEIHRDQLQHNREDTGVRADPGTDVSNNSIHIELVQDKFTVVEPGTLSVDTAAKYGEVKPRTGQPKSKRYTVSGSADEDHLLASTLRNLAPGCIATPEEIWNNEVEATQRQIYYMTMRQNVHLLESYTPQRRLETAHGSPPPPSFLPRSRWRLRSLPPPPLPPLAAVPPPPVHRVLFSGDIFILLTIIPLKVRKIDTLNHKAAVLIAASKSLGIMKYDSKYYFTDSHSCGPKGASASNGRA
ncbi:hypothetical protein M8J77_004891 [Diaphorina citri]|nr:hypothetical protein M8J77_004891 [Diaphorina citri]